MIHIVIYTYDYDFLIAAHIDMAVIEGAKKFMRKTCGTCLDDLEGDNYKVT